MDSDNDDEIFYECADDLSKLELSENDRKSTGDKIRQFQNSIEDKNVTNSSEGANSKSKKENALVDNVTNEPNSFNTIVDVNKDINLSSALETSSDTTKDAEGTNESKTEQKMQGGSDTIAKQTNADKIIDSDETLDSKNEKEPHGGSAESKLSNKNESAASGDDTKDDVQGACVIPDFEPHDGSTESKLSEESGNNTKDPENTMPEREESTADGSIKENVKGACGGADSDDESSEEEDESSLTEQELEERKLEGKKLKDEGNVFYKNSDFVEAERLYTEALKICPKRFEKERSVMFSNRSACLVRAEKTELAIADCTKAIELHPTYVKALLRRAQLYEKLEKYEEALKDYERLLELDPTLHSARAACLRIPGEIEKRNEKLKAQMMSSLKDLGNMFLRPFGLSTNNFQLQQDPNSGSYNIQFNNSPGGNNNNNNGPSNGPNRPETNG